MPCISYLCVTAPTNCLKIENVRKTVFFYTVYILITTFFCDPFSGYMYCVFITFQTKLLSCFKSSECTYLQIKAFFPVLIIVGNPYTEVWKICRKDLVGVGWNIHPVLFRDNRSSKGVLYVYVHTSTPLLILLHKIFIYLFDKIQLSLCELLCPLLNKTHTVSVFLCHCMIVYP